MPAINPMPEQATAIGDGGNAAIANAHSEAPGGAFWKTTRLAPLFLLPAVFAAYSVINGWGVFNSMIEQDAPELLSAMSWVDGSAQQMAQGIFAGASAHHSALQQVSEWKRLQGYAFGAQGPRIGKNGRLFFSDNFNFPEDVTSGVHAAVERVTQAVKHLNDHGTEVTIVVLPAKAEVEQEHLFWPIFGDRARDARILLVGELQSRGLRVLDGFPALLAAKSNGEVSGPNDMHWTVLGARSVAEAVGKFMGRAPQEDVLLVPGEWKMVQGDLAAVLSSGASDVQSEYLRSYPVQPYVAYHRAGVDLDPDFTEADIVVVGTSSTKIEDLSFANFLRYELQQPIANMALWGRGPFEPMDVAIEAFATSGVYPQRIIWEINPFAPFNTDHMSAYGSKADK